MKKIILIVLVMIICMTTAGCNGSCNGIGTGTATTEGKLYPTYEHTIETGRDYISYSLNSIYNFYLQQKPELDKLIDIIKKDNADDFVYPLEANKNLKENESNKNAIQQAKKIVEAEGFTCQYVFVHMKNSGKVSLDFGTFKDNDYLCFLYLSYDADESHARHHVTPLGDNWYLDERSANY